MRTYNLYCNFCGNQFEVSRWDAKTCSHEHRTRLARMSRFVASEAELYCIICGSKFNPIEKTNKTGMQEVVIVPIKYDIFCGAECHQIHNKLKVYGMTDEIEKRIKAIKKKREKISNDNENKEDKKSIMDKLLKKEGKYDLALCKECNQMTNHIKGICQKCKIVGNK